MSRLEQRIKKLEILTGSEIPTYRIIVINEGDLLPPIADGEKPLIVTLVKGKKFGDYGLPQDFRIPLDHTHEDRLAALECHEQMKVIAP